MIKLLETRLRSWESNNMSNSLARSWTLEQVFLLDQVTLDVLARESDLVIERATVVAVCTAMIVGECCYGG